MSGLMLNALPDRMRLQGSRQSIDGEDFELRQLAWTTLAQLLQHEPAAVNTEAYNFIRCYFFGDRTV